MAHPQNSPRGLFAKNRIDVGAQYMTANSTAVVFSGAVAFSGVSAKTITSNSTGIKIGARYISTNTTGNATT